MITRVCLRKVTHSGTTESINLVRPGYRQLQLDDHRRTSSRTEKYLLKQLIKGSDVLRLVETATVCSSSDQGSISWPSKQDRAERLRVCRDPVLASGDRCPRFSYGRAKAESLLRRRHPVRLNRGRPSQGTASNAMRARSITQCRAAKSDSKAWGASGARVRDDSVSQ